MITTKAPAQTRTPLQSSLLKQVAQGDSRRGTGFTSKAVSRARTRSFQGSVQSYAGFLDATRRKIHTYCSEVQAGSLSESTNPNPRIAQNPGPKIAIRIVRDDRRLPEPLQPSRDVAAIAEHVSRDDLRRTHAFAGRLFVTVASFLRRRMERRRVRKKTHRRWHTVASAAAATAHRETR